MSRTSHLSCKYFPGGPFATTFVEMAKHGLIVVAQIEVKSNRVEN